jgi:general stress protein YciG
MNPVLDPHNHSVPQASEEPREEREVAKTAEAPRPRKPRGFAAMDRNKVSEIASKGGKAAHAAGTAHQFTSDEARAAGKKGGVAPHVRRGRGPRDSAVVPAAEASGTSVPTRKEAQSA